MLEGRDRLRSSLQRAVLSPWQGMNSFNGGRRSGPGLGASAGSRHGGMKPTRQSSSNMRSVDNAPATQTVGFSPKQFVEAASLGTDAEINERMEFGFKILIGTAIEVQVSVAWICTAQISFWRLSGRHQIDARQTMQSSHTTSCIEQACIAAMTIPLEALLYIMLPCGSVAKAHAGLGGCSLDPASMGSS